MLYTRESLNKVKDADILQCFENTTKKGRIYKTDCPGCNRKLGLDIYNDRYRKKRAAKCHHCGLFIGDPIRAVQIIHHWEDRIHFKRAIEEAARLCNIELEEEE